MNPTNQDDREGGRTQLIKTREREEDGYNISWIKLCAQTCDLSCVLKQCFKLQQHSDLHRKLTLSIRITKTKQKKLRGTIVNEKDNKWLGVRAESRHEVKHDHSTKVTNASDSSTKRTLYIEEYKGGKVANSYLEFNSKVCHKKLLTGPAT